MGNYHQKKGKVKLPLFPGRGAQVIPICGGDHWPNTQHLGKPLLLSGKTYCVLCVIIPPPHLIPPPNSPNPTFNQHYSTSQKPKTTGHCRTGLD